MKKTFRTCVTSLLILLSITMVCYAGDIPESLLGDDSSQVYFGEIKNVDGESITVIQRQNIKGGFSKDSELTYAYTEFGFTDAPKQGEVYLCGFLNENNPLYVWEVTSLDTKDLEIKKTDGMSKRMQQYLNDGLFEEKEKERLAVLDTNSDTQASPKETTPASATGGIGQTDDLTSEGNSFAFPLILGGTILIGIVFLLWKKRKQ